MRDSDSDLEFPHAREPAVTASKGSVRLLLQPVADWLDQGGDAWQMDLDYWATRHALLNSGEMLDGPASEFLSNIDTAMDSYNPDPDPEFHQIDEVQLRRELDQAIASLKKLGYLVEEGMQEEGPR
jgi:hypothetical protein